MIKTATFLIPSGLDLAIEREAWLALTEVLGAYLSITREVHA